MRKRRTVLAGVVSLFVPAGCLRMEAMNEDETTERVADRELVVEITGAQFYWDLDAEDGLDARRGEVVLPSDTLLRVAARSDDVLHGFAIPEIGFQIDVIPGEVTRGTFRFETVDGDTTLQTQSGTQFDADRYVAQCTELCGAGHAEMTADVYVLSRADYANYVGARDGELPSSFAG